MDCLKKWIVDNGGVVNDKLTLKVITPNNRAIVAYEQINLGERLLLIPDKLCINKTLFNTVPNAELITEKYDDDTLTICVLLYNMFIIKETSFYKPYLDLLPLDFSYHPVYKFTEDKRDLWTKISPRVMQLIDKLIDKINETYKNIVKLNLFDSSVATLNNVKLCFMILRTRQWGDPGLVPLADLLQHSNTSGMLLQHNQSEKYNVMTNTNIVEKDCLVCDNYGVNDDISLFTSFGFVENIEDDEFMRTVRLNIEPKIDTSKTIGRFKQTEIDRYMLSCKSFFISNKGINVKLLEFLRICALSDTDIKLIDINTKYYEKLITYENESQVYNWILKIISEFTDINKEHHNFCLDICKKYDMESIEYKMAKLVLFYHDTVNKTIAVIINRWFKFLTVPFDSVLNITFPTMR